MTDNPVEENKAAISQKDAEPKQKAKMKIPPKTPEVWPLCTTLKNMTSLSKPMTAGKTATVGIASRAVKKSLSLVKANIAVRPASSVVMEKIFRLGRQDQHLKKEAP
jgi:hypothetical protein